MKKPNRYQIKQFIKKAGITKAQFIAMGQFSEKFNEKRAKREEENK